MKLLSTSEAAALLSKPLREIQRLIATGRLPAQRVGGRYVITEEAVAAFQSWPRGRPRRGACACGNGAVPLLLADGIPRCPACTDDERGRLRDRSQAG